MLKAAGLILNEENLNAVKCAEKASVILRRHQILTFNPQTEDCMEKPDLIITFGGDGTLLIGARYAMKYDIPHLEEAITAIIENRYHVEKRSLLHVTNTNTGDSFYALNDAVITRGGYARLIRVDATVDKKEYGTFTADGIIVATPTGSTGYSLSAGGPIVEPGMNCMIITPVCPHSMQHCPCIVSEKSDICLLLKPEREQTAELQIDGQNMGSLSTGDEIHVTGTERKISLIRLHPYDFFGLVRRKLSEWGS